MNKTDLIFFSLLADKRARESGKRHHVVRVPALYSSDALRIVEEGGKLPAGAVRVHSSPRVGGRKRRAYR